MPLILKGAIISVERSNDQTRLPIEAHVVVHPIHEDDHSVPKSDKKEQVYEHPNEPGKNTLESNILHIHYRLVPSNSGHTALIPVNKRFQGSIFQ